MKFGEIAPKVPGGGKISLAPTSLLSYVLGGALILVLFGFSKTLSNQVASKLPGRLSNYGAPAAPASPYAGLNVWQ